MEKTEVVGCFAKQIYPAGISDDPTVWTVSVFELKEVVKTPSGELKTRITVAGSGVPKSKKLTYKLVGEWRTHPVYEEQFALETYEEVVSKTKFGIISYLASGQIKGIGRTLAERTFNMFGEQTLEVLDANPQGLLKVQDISQKKLNEIIDSYTKNRIGRAVIAFLAPYGIGPRRALEIAKEWGSGALARIQEKPYDLCKVNGIGFTTADWSAA